MSTTTETTSKPAAAAPAPAPRARRPRPQVMSVTPAAVERIKALIEDAKFKTFGCGSAIASSSLVTEWVKGKTIDEAETIKNTDIAKHLALPPVKIHCSVLAEDAIKAAIADYRAKMAQKIEPKAEAAE